MNLLDNRVERELIKAATALHKHKGILETVFESMVEGVIVADLEGKFHVFNAAAQRIIGKGAVEARPDDWPDIYGAFHPDTITPWGKDDLVLLKAIQGQATDYVEAFFRNPQNQKGTFVGVTGRPLIDEDGKLSGGVIIISDITERKQAEAEREALIADLERRNAELERFAYTVSHDLKAPLVTIKGFLGLLKRDIASKDAECIQTDMQQIAIAADTMNELLEDLLELSRVGQVVNTSESVSLRRLVSKSIGLMAGYLEELDVEISIYEDLPTVFGDPDRLLEVFQNLVENAIKFMGDQPKPRVEIGVRHENEQAIFYVRDNGIGIDAIYQEKVFGLFERLDLQIEGTGIGLTLVKRIVELHGGSIWVESEGEGKGSTFCFTLSGEIRAQAESL